MVRLHFQSTWLSQQNALYFTKYHLKLFIVACLSLSKPLLIQINALWTSHRTIINPAYIYLSFPFNMRVTHNNKLPVICLYLLSRPISHRILSSTKPQSLPKLSSIAFQWLVEKNQHTNPKSSSTDCSLSAATTRSVHQYLIGKSIP